MGFLIERERERSLNRRGYWIELHSLKGSDFGDLDVYSGIKSSASLELDHDGYVRTVSKPEHLEPDGC
jgi:hypothetical protein